MLARVAPLLPLAAAVIAQGDPSINTPVSVVQCQGTTITWISSSPPVIISVIPGGQPGAPALETIGANTASNSLVWIANFPAGTSITFQIRDSMGALGYSAPVTVQNSSDSSCLGVAVSPGTTSAAASTSAAATSTASAPSASTSPQPCD